MGTRLVSAFAGGIFLLLAAAATAAPIGVGDAFPVLASVNLAGAPLPETAGKVVLVDFWASWCAPCKASFPAYGRINSDFASKGLVIVAVSVDQDQAAYDNFVKKLAPGFFVAFDRDQSLVRRVEVPTMPTSYLLDRQGRVRFIHPGYHGAETEALIRREVETLLAEKAS
ncbi:MAG TPA: TlpA disulfide reductase family protein [Opitutaceae bacterium]